MATPVTESTLTATCRIMHVGSVIYSQGFESSLDSWVAIGAQAVTRQVEQGDDGFIPYAHRGDYVATMTAVPTSNGASRSISGLTIGRSYLFSAWAYSRWQASSVILSTTVGVVGVGASAAVAIPWVYPGADWIKVSYRFTATATSHTFELRATVPSSARTIQWDDILLVEEAYQTSTVTLKVLSSRVALDETRSPYGEATVVCEIPVSTDLDKLDTRLANPVRVTVAAGQTWLQPTTTAQSRSFDLALHHRVVDYDANTLTLIFRTDESLLIDSGNATTTVSTTAELDQKSLRGIVSTMLEKYYTQLEAGTADFDFTVTKNETNKVPNPSGETNATGYVTAAGASTIARTTAQFYVGTACVQTTATSGSMGISPTSFTVPVMSVVAGQKYWADVRLATSVSRSATLSLRWFDSSNATISTDVTASTTIPVVGGGWTRLSLSAVAPVGAVKAAIFATVASCSIGNILYSDAWMLVQDDGVILPAYFDGASGVDAYYTYAWSGTAHASDSNRIRLDSRDTRLLQQEPGTKDWDFLAQIVQAAGLRLFCDEGRLWRLINPTTYIVAGTSALDLATNLTRALDTISKESQDWFDSVVVKYSWIDSTGLSQTAYDASGSGNTVLHKEEWQRPYPGPGAAAAILARASGRGRVQVMRALSDLNVAPSRAITTNLPPAPAQSGFASAVEWVWSASSDDSDEMTITSRALS